MCNKTSPTPNELYTRFDGRPGTFLSGSLGAPTTGLLDVGARRSDTTCAFEGWIGELLIYETAKTSVELEFIRGYLLNKWGTPAGDPLTVALATASGTFPQSTPVTVTATFSESVTGFTSGDVAVTNGSVTAFSGSGTTYTITVTPTTAYSSTTVDVAAGAASTASGKLNIVANQLTFTYSPPRPTP
eukprot:jgi/Mesvir1/27881/Mv20068-RA.1